MENLYCIFENLAVKMSATLIFVMAIKLIFKNKLSAKTHFMIWLLPLVQLIFCIGDIQLQTDTSIYTVINTADITRTGVSYKATLTAGWLAGAAVFALWHIITYALYMREIRRLPKAADTHMVEELRVRLAIPHRRRLTLRIGKSAQTVAATIIIPDNFSEKENYHILLHELCHFRYHDNLKLWLALAMLCVNWFNPLMWIAFRMFRTDIEMLCDERVLKLTDSKREYAQVLVKSSAIHPKFVPGAVSASSGRREVFARIKRIVNFSTMKPLWLLTAIVGCSAAALLCLTVPKEMAQKAEEAIAEPTPEIVVAEPAEGDALDIVIDVPTTAPQPAMQETPTAPPQSAAQNKAGNVSSRPKPVRQDTAPVRQSSGAEYVSNEQTDNSIEWEAPSEGVRESVSGNGSKETYRLDDGSQAVVQYDDGEVTNRYIIVE